MPASPKSSGTAGSIVLVEEYGALAVAISSALKKFAPNHSTRSVGTLAEAEALIAARKPELLVIDFDPPHPGALEFFTKLKAAAPATRVLVIAAVPLGDLAGARKASGAFHFVEKPFELATLGTGVGALLRAADHPRWSGGTLRDLSVSDIIPLQCLSRVTAVLKVDAAEGRTGEIHFIDGQIAHVETSDSDGDEALQEMVGWRSPRFKELKRRPRTARTIHRSWTSALLDALAKAAGAGDEATPAEGNDGIEVRPGGGKKIVVIDDTEMLLVFVEDSLATADPMLEITVASTGIEGVDRVLTLLPDLILLDYSLPDINGDEVCQRLLQNERTAAIPVIMMSGHVPEMAASALRFQNIVATLAKPFLSEALIELVTKVLADPAQFAVRPAPRRSTAPAPLPEPVVAPDCGDEQHDNGHLRRSEPATSAALPAASVPKTSAGPTLPPLAVPLSSDAEAPGARPLAVAVPSVPALTCPEPVRQLQQLAAAKPTAIAPAPPIPIIASPPRPLVQRTPAPVVAKSQAAVMPAIQPAAVLPMQAGIAPARIAAAPSNAVVLAVQLEVLAIQFSPALQMAAIRARPAARTVSLHIDPTALPGVNLPEAGFELGPANLDARGQIDTLRLLPTSRQITPVQPRTAFPVAALTVLPSNGEKALELTPAASAPMTMQLFASFELAGVELSPGFRVGSLVLRARAGEIRVRLHRAGGATGATFKTAQVLLNRSGEVAEILLDAVA